MAELALSSIAAATRRPEATRRGLAAIGRRMNLRTSQLIGWWLFLASALLFTLASWRAGDWISLGGSLLFLIACLLFLVPLIRNTE